MICPLCGSYLELKQINFTIAIYICTDLKCPYPVNGQCLEVYRKLEDMNNIPPQQHTTHNNNSIGSLNENHPQILPGTEQNKDVDLDLLIENTLMNLNNCLNQSEAQSVPTGLNTGLSNDNKIEQFQSVPMISKEHLDELESIFSELR